MAILLALVSCEKDIDIDYHQVASLYVVEASVNQDRSSVRITMSQDMDDNSGGKVWEYIDDFADASDMEMLRAIASANEVLVRFQGKDYAVDMTLTDTDKAAIRQTLEVFDALIASGYHDAT